MECSLLGSSVHGIFQARVLEWVAIALSPRSGDLAKEKRWMKRVKGGYNSFVINKCLEVSTRYVRRRGPQRAFQRRELLS